MMSRIWIVRVWVWLTLTVNALSADRIVYPQAAVGPISGQEFVIELKLGNRSPNFPWTGTVRLLEKTTLAGMAAIQVSGPLGPVDALEGEWPVTLSPDGTVSYTVASPDQLQTGVLVVEAAAGSRAAGVVASFFYRLTNPERGKVQDLIAVQPAREAGLSFETLISRSRDFNVGLAMVAEAAVDGAGASVPETEVTLTMTLDGGETLEALISLGGAAPEATAQRAVFPHEVFESLPETFEAARLRIAAAEPIFVTLLGVGTPPLFEDVQIGATPAEVAGSRSLRLREGWEFVPGAEELLAENFWECAGPRIDERPGGLVSRAGPGYETRVNLAGTSLELTGDFGLSALLHAGTGQGYLVAVGSLADGPQWWSNLRRLDLGLEGGRLVVAAYDNSPNPVVRSYFDSGTLQGATAVELARVGSTFEVYADGTLGGSFPDFALTDGGRLWVGTNIAPGSSLTLFGIAAERRQDSPESVASVPPAPREEVAVRNPSLRTEAGRHNLSVGAAAAAGPFFSERIYREILGGVFNQLVAENVMKWSTIHPERDRYSFCSADALVEFAEANGMTVRGHTLVWHQQNPQWLEEVVYSREGLIQILRDHIFEVAGRYRGRIAEWDVLNEAFEWDGTLRQTVWLDGIGEEYIDLVFRWAHEADPEARLFYNDYGTEEINAKSTAVLEYVRGMLERGVPIHGVGFQGHVGIDSWTRPSVDSLLANLQRFRALGLDVALTEVDVRIPLIDGQPSPGQLETQAQVFQEMLEACLEAECSSFVTWGFTDRHSWIPGFTPGYGAALLFDEDYNPKPAYQTLLEMLQGD